jgi:hypothetical protein
MKDAENLSFFYEQDSMCVRKILMYLKIKSNWNYRKKDILS